MSAESGRSTEGEVGSAPIGTRRVRKEAFAPLIAVAIILAALAASPGTSLGVIRFVTVSAAALVVLASRSGRDPRVWMLVTFLGVSAEALSILSARPQIAQPSLLALGVVVAATGAVLWSPSPSRRFVAYMYPLASGLTMSASFPTRGTVLAPLLWAAVPASAALLASHILSDASSDAEGPRGSRHGALFASSVLAILALGGLGREYGRLHIEGVDYVYPSAGSSLSFAALAPAVTLLLAALYMLASKADLKPAHNVRVAMVGLLLVSLVSPAPAASLVLDAPENFGRSRIDSALELDRQRAYGEVRTAGAGPRLEYRGYTFEQCDSLNNRDCFITHYDDIALRYGVAAAVDDVLGKVKDNKGFTFPSHCHQVVHNLGQMAFQLSREFEYAAALDPQVCGTGYTHGLWEQQMVRLGADVWFTQTGTLCEQLNMRTPWYKWTCSHILGHLLSTSLMGNPAVAVEYCNAIDDMEALTDCYTGAWMNFFQDDSVIAWFRSFGTVEELFEICYGAAESVKLLCYQEMFPVLYPMVDGSDFLAAEACLRLAEPTRYEGDPYINSSQNYADKCVQGLARAVAVSAAFSADEVLARCRSKPSAAHDTCLTATAASIVLNTGSIAFVTELCEAVSDEGYREYCFFWTKHSRRLLLNGPNSQNMPGPDEIRRSEGVFVPPNSSERPFSFRTG